MEKQCSKCWCELCLSWCCAPKTLGNLMFASEKCLGGKCYRTAFSEGLLCLLWEFETTFGILFNRKGCFTSVWGLSDADLLVLWPSLTGEGFLVTWLLLLLLKPPAGFVVVVALSTWSQPLETAFAKRSVSITGEGYASREVYLFKEGLVTC